MPYLKANLPLNQVAEVTILKRKGIVEGQFGPKMAYTMQYNGVVYDHEATQSEEGKGLSVIKEGEMAHAKKVPNPHGKGEMIYWALPNGAEARALTQPVSNQQQDRNNNAAKEYEQAKKDEAHKKEMGYAKGQIGNNLGMSTKLFMDGLRELKPYDGVSLQKTPEEYLEEIFLSAAKLAKKVRPAFNGFVEECYMHDVVGTNKVSPETSVKVPLPAHVAEAFGIDPSPTL